MKVLVSIVKEVEIEIDDKFAVMADQHPAFSMETYQNLATEFCEAVATALPEVLFYCECNTEEETRQHLSTNGLITSVEHPQYGLIAEC